MSESIEQYRARRTAESQAAAAQDNARRAADRARDALQKSNAEAMRKAAADARAALRR